MKRSCLLIACCVLLSAESIPAQSGGTAGDPISGTWTGVMGPGAVPVHRMTMELKFDGKAAVSGTITGLPTPGEVKKGTFDPNTGAIRLEAGETGNSSVLLVLEGTVVLGTATGRGSGDNQTGTFIITKAGSESKAAELAGGSDAAELRRSFADVSGWVTKAADLVPADKYTYRPAQSVRTFGQLIAHVADSYDYYCARAAGRNAEWSDAIEKGSTDKATLLQKLKQSLETCNKAYSGQGQAGALIDNVGHTSLHYGNIVTYMRMLGLVPPSS